MQAKTRDRDPSDRRETKSKDIASAGWSVLPSVIGDSNDIDSSSLGESAFFLSERNHFFSEVSADTLEGVLRETKRQQQLIDNSIGEVDAAGRSYRYAYKRGFAPKSFLSPGPGKNHVTG